MATTENKHILDRPVWNALSTRHAHLAIGDDFARRFEPEIGPLTATLDDSPQCQASLKKLIPEEGKGTIILLQADPILLPDDDIEAVSLTEGVQMLGLDFRPQTSSENIQRLGPEDLPAMLALASLTKPGPFESGTPRLGEFWGIKEQGILLAMAGERLKHDGYAEVSGVCTHPTARGRGFARALSAHVATRICGRDETPYLHAYAVNLAAIGLYESLGFSIRCRMNVAVLTRKIGPTS